jgi:hypothetical protein
MTMLDEQWIRKEVDRSGRSLIRGTNPVYTCGITASIFSVEEWAKQEASMKQVTYVPPKRRLAFNGIHCIISHNTELFITTIAKTWNPIEQFLLDFWGLYLNSYKHNSDLLWTEF